MRRFHVERDATLITVEHGKVQAINIWEIAQLSTGDIAAPRRLEFNHIGTQKAEHLRTGRSRLHMRHIQDTHPIQGFSHNAPPLWACHYCYIMRELTR